MRSLDTPEYTEMSQFHFRRHSDNSIERYTGYDDRTIINVPLEKYVGFSILRLMLIVRVSASIRSKLLLSRMWKLD